MNNLKLTNRLARRLASARFYYTRQQLLYIIHQEAPDVANTIGIYPKVDNSHGFTLSRPYEMYRDWQENTINSDGWFAMMVYIVCFIYTAHVVLTYLIPFYWIRFERRNESLNLWRMKGKAEKGPTNQRFSFFRNFGRVIGKQLQRTGLHSSPFPRDEGEIPNGVLASR